MNEDEILNLWSQMSAHPGSPAALGAGVFLVMWALTDSRIAPWLLRAPYLGVVLSSPAGKRATAVLLTIAPGLALALSQHMSWNDAARTSLLTFAVSQGLKLLSKAPAVIPLALILLSQSACGVDKAKIERGLNGAAYVLDAAKPCLSALEEEQTKACGADMQCKSDVRTRYDAIALGYDAFGCVLCLIDESAEGCAEDDPCDRLVSK